MTPSGPACAACPYAPIGHGFMTSDGDLTSGVLIVGEALGAVEAAQGKALVGPSGFLLGRVMTKQGWRREAFRYANTLYCQPPKNVIRDRKGRLLPVVEQALAYCPYLDEEIDRSHPKVVLALGETAFERLTGERLPMMAARGYVFRELKGRCWVVPTFHPAHVLRGMNHLALVLGWDLAKACRVAALPAFTYDVPSCLMDPPLPLWEGAVAEMQTAIRKGAPLALDIETPYKSQRANDEDELGEDDETWQIDRLSLAVGPDRGVSVAWRMPYLPGVEALVKTALDVGQIVIWNRPYDRPRVAKALGMAIPLVQHTMGDGCCQTDYRCLDTMDAWHVLYNALPKKLGFASSCFPGNDRIEAWKHLSGLMPEFYSAMDAIMLWRNHRDILHLLEETGQMACYARMCIELDPVLELMTAQGLLVDETARVALEAELEAKMAASAGAMQTVVPPEVKGLKVWKTQRAALKGLEILGRVGAELEPVAGTVRERTCQQCGAHPVTKTHVTRKTVTDVSA